MPHAVHQPCYGFTFYWRKRTKKDQKIEKCRGEGQFFCLHRLFMLVLWTLVRRTEAGKSRCCLKSYLKGGWSEEMSGQTCDCGFSWPCTVWYPAAWQLYPISSVNGVLICLSFPLCLIWGCWFLTPEFVGRTSCSYQFLIDFSLIFLILLTHSDPHLY